MESDTYKPCPVPPPSGKLIYLDFAYKTDYTTKMKPRKLSKTEGEIINSLRKFLDTLKGKSGVTCGWFCQGSTTTCGDCRQAKCTMFYKGSLSKITWNPDLLLDLLSGKIKLVFSTGNSHDFQRFTDNPNGKNVYIDFSKKQWWTSKEGYKHAFWSSIPIEDDDPMFQENTRDNEKFLKSVSLNLSKLLDELQIYHHKERGKLHSRDFGI